MVALCRDAQLSIICSGGIRVGEVAAYYQSCQLPDVVRFLSDNNGIKRNERSIYTDPVRRKLLVSVE